MCHEVFGRVMDAIDPALVAAAEAALATVPGVQDVRELRLRWIGDNLRAEVELGVDPDLSAAQAHEVAAHAEQHLISQLPRFTAATIATSPAHEHADPTDRSLR